MFVDPRVCVSVLIPVIKTVADDPLPLSVIGGVSGCLVHVHCAATPLKKIGLAYQVLIV